MTNEVTATTTVNVPVREVYDQWTQFAEFPRFMSAVRSVEQLDDVNTRWEVEIGGVKRSFDAAITEQRPDELIEWRSTEGEFHQGAVTFAAVDDATQVTLTMVWIPEGILETLGSAMNIDQRSVERDLEKFKTFIEERHIATGEWRGTVTE